MKAEIKKEEHRHFDQAHSDRCGCKKVQRQMTDAVSRIRLWLKKEFRNAEPLPKEFKDFIPTNEQERMKSLWGKYL